jgi:hypothetical protein
MYVHNRIDKFSPKTNILMDSNPGLLFLRLHAARAIYLPRQSFFTYVNVLLSFYNGKILQMYVIDTSLCGQHWIGQQ